jgi:glycosyltransferase involved in cell wall biosynthesis
MIAFICHPYHRGGVTRWMVDMATEYAQNGEQVFFITVNPRRTFYSSGNSETIISLLEGVKGVEVVTSNVGWEYEFGTESYRAQVYKRLLATYVPLGTPVILSDDTAAWAVSALLKGAYRFVGVLHSDEPKYYEVSMQYQASIDIWTCVSGRVKRKLQEYEAFKEKKIFVIPCGIFIPANERQPEEGIADPVRLVYLGRLTEYQKRISDLLKVAVGLKKEGVNFHLNVIGDGDDRPRLEQKCVAEALDKQVSFTGWLSKKEILSILFQTDLLILTSDFEGMPIAVMEGLSTGCGIISTRVSGVEDLEYLKAATSCIWLNEVGEIQEAVNNIKLAIKIPVATRVASARQVAEDEFDMKTCIERYNIAINNTVIEKPINIKKQIPVTERLFSYLLAYSRYIRVKRQNRSV